MNFPSRRKRQWRVVSRNFHSLLQNNKTDQKLSNQCWGKNVKIKAQICIPSGAAYNCFILKEEELKFLKDATDRSKIRMASKSDKSSISLGLKGPPLHIAVVY